ncbi:uncharacterized protein C8Q71DRAFT_757088 [Rhodofomes roseus]|uniref:Uncharacterized protein n=1 Tax=Rhodofomes roseus TaxID=34475 RepID=A0ABQ8KIG2_9APHY|nr:uncharacterized protein C8Q71DRAFT_757088 [Rhodofomes roseus]KAH9837177.1 hypothetical protein C8Q71DRAFT_757088 [Rhodofomes roseus]
MRAEAEEDRKRRKLARQPLRRNAVPLGSQNYANRADRPSNCAYRPTIAYLAYTLILLPTLRDVIATYQVVTTSVKATSKSRTGSHSVKVKTTISRTPVKSRMSPVVKSRMSPARVRTPVNVRKTVAQSKPKAVFIDLTLTSDSSDDESVPPNPRARCPTAASSSSASSSKAVARPQSASAPKGEDEEMQEEAMLEDMLTAHIDSDMDLQSSSDNGEVTMDLGTNSDYESDDGSNQSDMDLDPDALIIYS